MVRASTRAATLLAFVPVAGRVALAAGQPTEVEVSWKSGPARSGWALATTRPGPDGVFSFALGVNVDGSALVEPIDNRDCQTCHDPTNEGFSVGAGHLVMPLAGEVRLGSAPRRRAACRASDERWVTVDPSGQATWSVQMVR